MVFNFSVRLDISKGSVTGPVLFWMYLNTTDSFAPMIPPFPKMMIWLLHSKKHVMIPYMSHWFFANNLYLHRHYHQPILSTVEQKLALIHFLSG